MADLAERVAYLAGLEVECPGIEIEPGVFSGCDTRGGTLTDCPECHGGGKVPRFPMLRRWPTAQELRSLPHAGEARELWVPVASPGALMEAAATFPDWAVGRWGFEEPVMAEVDGWAGEGASPAEALSLAICKAVGGER